MPKWKPHWLTKALTRYTNLDPNSKDGIIILNSHFISQSFSDIQRKLKQAEDAPPLQGDLVKMAFKVFNSQEETRYQQKAHLLADAMKPPLPTLRRADQHIYLQGPATSATRWDTGQNTVLFLIVDL
jgi:hypothetical protein